MTNELTTQEDLLVKYGAASTSENSDGEGMGLPYLSMRKGYDMSGKKPKELGVFFINSGKSEEDEGDSEDEVEVEAIKFRPLAHYERYKSWNDDFSGVTNESTLFKPFKNDTALDKLGTVACGRPLGDAFKALDPDTQSKWRKDAPIYVVLFGIVNLEGEDQLVCFETRGLKSGVVRDALKSVRGQALYNTCFDLSQEKDKKGDYFNLVMTQDKEYTVEDPSTIYPMLKEMDDFVVAHNNVIREAHFEAVQTKQEDATIEAEVFIEAEVEEVDIDDDFPI